MSDVEPSPAAVGLAKLALKAAAVSNHVQYGEQHYWEKRYTREPVLHDWYQEYAALKPLICTYFKPEDPILQVGVGTSRLQEDMVRDAGFTSITNIDFSSTAVRHMSRLHQELKALQYKVADVRQMPQFQTGEFAGVLDKGTLDAILCGSDSSRNAMMMLMECSRVLAPGSIFMMVTYGGPSSRLPYLEREELNWEVGVHCIRKPSDPTSAPEVGSDMPVVIQGPYPSSDRATMTVLSDLETVHYVYVCRKNAPTA